GCHSPRVLNEWSYELVGCYETGVVRSADRIRQPHHECGPTQAEDSRIVVPIRTGVFVLPEVGVLKPEIAVAVPGVLRSRLLTEIHTGAELVVAASVINVGVVVVEPAVLRIRGSGEPVLRVPALILRRAEAHQGNVALAPTVLIHVLRQSDIRRLDGEWIRIRRGLRQPIAYGGVGMQH